MIEELIKYNLQLQAVAINHFKKHLNLHLNSNEHPGALFDAINGRLDEAIRLQKRVTYLERLKLNGKKN